MSGDGGDADEDCFCFEGVHLSEKYRLGAILPEAEKATCLFVFAG